MVFKGVLESETERYRRGGTYSTSRGDERSAYSIFTGKPKGKRKVGRSEGK
jgi:hypothetical protein